MRTAPALAACVLAATAALGHGGESGVGAGACIPSGDLADVNDTSWYVQARTVFARKMLGGRVGAYYADTVAHGAVDGGRAFGFDLEGLARFGSPMSYAYVFAGAGYGRSTFSRPGDLPGAVVRSSEWDWSMQGGVGVVIRKKVYVEAMYVQFQTDPKSSFIPVVLGMQY